MALFAEGRVEAVEKRADLERECKSLRLREAELTYFLDILFHEIKTALTPVVASVGLLEESCGTDGARTRLVKSLSSSITNLESTVGHLMDLAQTRAGIVKLHLEMASVSPLIKEAVTRLLSLSEKRGQSLKLEMPSELPPVRVDRDRFSRAMFYLLTNAIDITPEGGGILIRAQVADGDLVISIRDGGPALPPEVYEPALGKRVQEADRRLLPDVALGLAVVRQLIETHGGKMWLKTGPAGNLVSISLPCVERPSERDDARGRRQQH